MEPIGKPIEKHPCLHEGAYALCVYCPKYKDYILWGACRQCSYNSDGVAKLTNNPKCLYELTPTERSKIRLARREPILTERSVNHGYRKNEKLGTRGL